MGIHRDRGRRKKHHKPRGFAAQADRWAEFEQWLEEEFRDPDGNPILPSHTLSLKDFLQNCGPIELAADEKLRQLAIFWEYECSQMKQPGGWNILKRIYATAIEYDPAYQSNYHSCSLSARVCANGLDRDSGLFTEILDQAKRVCFEGTQKATECSLIWLSLGRIEYELGATEAALECFEKSIEGEDDQVMWAVLYRAHCLQDLKRWPEAVIAYREVDRSYFDGDLSWRAVLLRDQLAYCLFESGSEAESRDMFETCFFQYESNPGLLSTSDYLEHACKFFPGDFASRGADLFSREGFPDAAAKARSRLKLS